jgi:hypothetical protein
MLFMLIDPVHLGSAQLRPAWFAGGKTPMRLGTLVAAALLAMALFPVTHALALTLEEQQGGSSTTGSAQIADPDEQLDIFGLQNQSGGSESDPTVKVPHANPTFNAAPPSGFPTYNPFAPLAPPQK